VTLTSTIFAKDVAGPLPDPNPYALTDFYE